MAKYLVSLSAPAGHSIPPLLAKFGAWLAAPQEHGALGYFNRLAATTIPNEWNEKNATRLQSAGYSFLDLADGSNVALLRHDQGTAVVLIGSEGETPTLANSLEEFLTLWSKGETGNGNLDDDNAKSGRKALAAWLKKEKVSVPKAPEFDFAGWLSGEPARPSTATARVRRAPTATTAKLGPKLSAIAALVGLPADSPEIIDYVTSVLGKRVPASTSRDSVWVSAPKLGLELLFDHDVVHNDYPPIVKTKQSFVPYLRYVKVSAKLGEPVLGVPWSATSEDDVATVLGAPHRRRANTLICDEEVIPVWSYSLDDGAHVQLDIEADDGLDIMLSIRGTRYLQQFTNVSTALFVAWAATRDLLDEARFATHAPILANLKVRKQQGSDFVRSALPRGLWQDHLRDAPGLRLHAYRWFHNMTSLWMTKDLIGVFGSRKGPHGHDEPALDEATWDAVDKAAPTFEATFAKWL